MNTWAGVGDGHADTPLTTSYSLGVEFVLTGHHSEIVKGVIRGEKLGLDDEVLGGGDWPGEGTDLVVLEGEVEAGRKGDDDEEEQYG